MKTGSKRGSGSGTGSGVLDAPETGYAPEAGRRRRGSDPSSSLQRPYGGYAAEAGGFDEFEADEPPPRLRRGGWRIRLRWIPRSVGGRIAAGVILLLVLGIVFLTLAGVRYFVLHDSHFVVATSADIQISGDAHLSRGQVLGVFADDIERNVFRIPLAERRTELEALPWVAHATVMRLLPNHIRVLITERTPVAFVRQGSQIGLVDANGVLLDMPREDAGDPSYSFPVLTGLSASDPLPTRAARMDLYRRFIDDLDSGSGGDGQKLSQTVSEVDVSNPEDVKALIASNGTDILVHFGDEQFLHRYQEFEEHLPEWKQQYPKLASADMRYEGQIVLEMQKGEAAPLAGTVGAPAAAGASPAVKKSAAPAKPAVRHEPQSPWGKARQQQIARQAEKKARLQARMQAQKRAAAKAAAKRTAYAGGGTTP